MKSGLVTRRQENKVCNLFRARDSIPRAATFQECGDSGKHSGDTVAASAMTDEEVIERVQAGETALEETVKVRLHQARPLLRKEIYAQMGAIAEDDQA
jgi:hypothetical protein